MVTRNTRVRFLDNNLLNDSSVTVTYSSNSASKARLYDETRSLPFEFSGNFEIDTSNNKFIFDDGGFKTGTLTSGTYTSTTLAAELKSAAEAVSTVTFTVTYSTTTKKFSIATDGNISLQLSVTTNAIWDTLGFSGTVNTAQGTSYTAEEVRIHTSEWIILDLVTPREVSAITGVAAIDSVTNIAQSAIIKIMGNNINDFTAPDFSATITDITDTGVYHFLDEESDNTFYRYWKFEIIDKDNPVGNPKFGELYIGDYTTITQRNVAKGFSKQFEDPSIRSTSESGVTYSQQRNKFWKFSDLGIQYLEASERRELEQFFYNTGITVPFFISLDPTLQCTTSLEELTKYVRFDSMPIVTHVKSDVYSVGFSVSEVI